MAEKKPESKPAKAAAREKRDAPADAPAPAAPSATDSAAGEHRLALDRQGAAAERLLKAQDHSRKTSRHHYDAVMAVYNMDDGQPVLTGDLSFADARLHLSDGTMFHPDISFDSRQIEPVKISGRDHAWTNGEAIVIDSQTSFIVTELVLVARRGADLFVAVNKPLINWHLAYGRPYRLEARSLQFDFSRYAKAPAE